VVTIQSITTSSCSVKVTNIGATSIGGAFQIIAVI
jgi:hypothetical protein